MDDRLPKQISRKIVRVPGGGCWLWHGSINEGGYGRVYYGGKPMLAHRVTYSLIVGAIPTGLQIDHLCRVRRCVNPAHMEPVTQRENTRRGEAPAARQSRQDHAKCGHPFDGMNSSGKRVCTECFRAAVSARGAAWYQANLDAARAKRRANAKAWREANREIINAKQREKKAANREAANAYQRAWYAANRVAGRAHDSKAGAQA